AEEDVVGEQATAVREAFSSLSRDGARLHGGPRAAPRRANRTRRRRYRRAVRPPVVGRSTVGSAGASPRSGLPVRSHRAALDVGNTSPRRVVRTACLGAVPACAAPTETRRPAGSFASTRRGGAAQRGQSRSWSEGSLGAHAPARQRSPRGQGNPPRARSREGAGCPRTGRSRHSSHGRTRAPGQGGRALGGRAT